MCTTALLQVRFCNEYIFAKKILKRWHQKRRCGTNAYKVKAKARDSQFLPNKPAMWMMWMVWMVWMIWMVQMVWMAYGSDGSDGWDGVDGVGDVDGSDVAAQTMRFTQVSIFELAGSLRWESGARVVLAWGKGFWEGSSWTGDGRVIAANGRYKSWTLINFMQIGSSCRARSAMRLANEHSVSTGGP